MALTVSLAAAAASGASTSSGFHWVLIAVLAVIFVAILYAALLATGAFRRVQDPATRLLDQLDRHYTGRHGQRPPGNAPGTRAASARSANVESARLLSETWEQRLAQRLDLAGVHRKPVEWILLGVAIASVAVLFLTLLTGSFLLGFLVGALGGWLAMRMTLSTLISRRQARFSQQLPDVLQLVAGSLQSGFSLAQALDAVVREGTQPSAAEYSRVLAEARIGGDMEDALDRVADRMDARDLRWAVMAIRIQRSVGGNLAEVLRTTAETMRERARVQRQVRALSAEGRLSGYILVALPILVGAFLFLTRPGYMRPLYTTPIGLSMLIGAAVLMVIGIFWMRNTVKLEV